MELDLQQQPYFYGASEPPIGSADGRKTVGQDHQHGKHDWIDARCEHGCVRRNKGSDAQSYCGAIQESWNARSNCQRDQPWPDQQCWRPILASDDGGGSWVAIRTCAAWAIGAWAPNPVGRMGRVEEVASLVAFVASPLADYINGSNLRIDGGLDPTIS